MIMLKKKTKKILEIEKKINENLEWFLHRKYIVEMKEFDEIAKELNVTKRTVWKWVIKIGIKDRMDWKKVMNIVEKRSKNHEERKRRYLMRYTRNKLKSGLERRNRKLKEMTLLSEEKERKERKEKERNERIDIHV